MHTIRTYRATGGIDIAFVRRAANAAVMDRSVAAATRDRASVLTLRNDPRATAVYVGVTPSTQHC